MSDIARLYCTHCTFGTSALENDTSDNAAKVLGYSVRASSFPDAERGRLRQVFRTIERLLSYDLPRDASAADKENRDAASAPRRLIFLPNLGDNQVVGQVCYRSHDTAKRPGSYFADMLVERIDPRQPERAWSPAECLELWAANNDGADWGGWWCDSEDGLAEQRQAGKNKPFAPVAAVRELREAVARDRPPLISLDVLRAFLFEEGDQIDVRDLGRVIPPRWREMPPEVRREFFARLLQATMEILPQTHAVVLAVEPSLAALLFYGACRLLPPKLTKFSGGQSGISFSTYEPFPERPMTRLVATTFLHGDSSADLPADVYQRGFACNTFRVDCNLWQSKGGRGRIPQPGDFVKRIVERLAIGGATGTEAAEEVGELLNAIDGLKKLSAPLLDDLIRIDDVVTAYVSGTRPLADLMHGPLRPNPDEDPAFRRQRFLKLVEQGEVEGRTEWPEDLLPVAIAWLGDSLRDLWIDDAAVARVLKSRLPTSPEQLKHLAQTKPPKELVRDAVISVAHAQRQLPDCLPEILNDRSGAALAEILRGLDDSLRQPIILASNPTLLGDTILAAVKLVIEDGCPQPEHFIESLLFGVLDDDKRAPDDKWNVLRKYATLVAGWVPDPVSRLAKPLDALFDRLDESPPRVLVGGDRGPAVEALQDWARLATKWEQHDTFLLRWRGVFDTLTPLTDEATKQAGKKFWSGGTTGLSDRLEKALQSIDKLNAERSQDWTEPRDKRRQARLEQALQLANPGPDVRERVKGWINAELKKGRKQATASTSRFPSRWLMWGLPMAVSVIGIVAVYSGATRDGLPSVDRTAAVQPPRVRPPGPSPLDPSKGDSSQDDAMRDRSATGGPPDASQPPKEAKPLTLDDLDLKAAFEGGELVITWKEEALQSATTWLMIQSSAENLMIQSSAENIETSVPVLALEHTPVTGTNRFCFPSKAGEKVIYGTKYTATLTAKKGSEPEIKKDAFAELPPPPAPLISNIDLDLDQQDTPRLRIVLKEPQHLQKYGNKLKYCLKCGDTEVGRAAFPEHENVFTISVPTATCPPEYLQKNKCSVLVVSPQGEGVRSQPLSVQADIAGFMKRQLEHRKVFGVPAWSLVDDKGDPSSEPFLLHPFLSTGQIGLKLLSPKYHNKPFLGLVLRENPNDKEVWEVSFVRPKQDLEKQDLEESTVGYGEFRVVRTAPWAPHLSYFPPAGQKKTDPLQLLRVAAAKLVVDLASVDAATHELQLIKPLSKRALIFENNESELIYNGPRIVSEESLVFQCLTLESALNSRLGVELNKEKQRLNKDLQFDWRYDGDLFAYQSACLKWLDNNDLILKRDKLKWAGGHRLLGSGDDKLTPVKDKPFSNTLKKPNIVLLLNYGCSHDRKKSPEFKWLTAHYLHQTSSPTELAAKLDALRNKLSDLNAHDSPGNIECIDDCLKRLQPLVEKEKAIDILVGASLGAKFTVSQWAIKGDVTDGSRKSQVTFIVCDPKVVAK